MSQEYYLEDLTKQSKFKPCMLISADDSWFAWPWSVYTSVDDDDSISVPTKINSLKHRIGNIFCITDFKTH